MVKDFLRGISTSWIPSLMSMLTLGILPDMPRRQNDDQLKFVFLPEDFSDQKLHEMCCLLEGYITCNVVRFAEKNCDGRREMIGKCNMLGFARFTSAEHASKAAAWFAKVIQHIGPGIRIEQCSSEGWKVKEVQVHVALPNDHQFSAQVVVRWIPLHWNLRDFERYFGRYGEMQRAVLGDNRIDGCRGGFVIFNLLASAESAVRDKQHNRKSYGRKPPGLQVQHKQHKPR